MIRKLITGILIVALSLLGNKIMTNSLIDTAMSEPLEEIELINISFERHSVSRSLDMVSRGEVTRSSDILYDKYEPIVETIRKKQQTDKDGSTAKDVTSALLEAYKEFELESFGVTLEQWFGQALVENHFHTTKRGYSGEYGMMQIMPSTARYINEKHFNIEGFEPLDLNDVYLNTRFAAQYLRSMLEKHDIGAAFECYNKGPRGYKYTDYQNRVFKAANSFMD